MPLRPCASRARATAGAYWRWRCRLLCDTSCCARTGPLCRQPAVCVRLGARQGRHAPPHGGSRPAVAQKHAHQQCVQQHTMLCGSCLCACLLCALLGSAYGERFSSSCSALPLTPRLSRARAALRHPRLLTAADDIEAAAAHVGFPAVIKPIAAAASMGVVRVDGLQQLKDKVAETQKQMASLYMDEKVCLLGGCAVVVHCSGSASGCCGRLQPAGPCHSAASPYTWCWCGRLPASHA